MEARSDERFMQLALELARRGIGDTSPNPAVGAVIVKSGKIVGAGYHKRAGLAHAEVEAIRQAKGKSKGSTMYVSLEPCNHVGRTGACTDAIIKAGIKRVVITSKDPNPIVNGSGISFLRRCGVEVKTGLCKAEADRLNAPFAKLITTGTPWVVAKVAQSIDGKIATRTGRSKWISSEGSLRLAHEIRRQSDAVVVGINTVLNDKPKLTVRYSRRKARAHRPIRVIIDSKLKTPLSSPCISGSDVLPTVIACTKVNKDKAASFKRKGVQVLAFKSSDGRVPLGELFRELARRYGVMSVLIEGGGEILASALSKKLIDRFVWIIAPMIIGGKDAVSSVGGKGISELDEAIRLKDVLVGRIGKDILVEAGIVYPHSKKKL